MLFFDESKILEKSIGEEATAVIAKVLERNEGKIHEGLATKEDVARLEGRISEDVARLEGRISEDVARLEGRISEEVARLEGRIAESEARMRGEFHRELGQVKVDIIKWMVTLMIGQAGLMAVILRFMLK